MKKSKTSSPKKEQKPKYEVLDYYLYEYNEYLIRKNGFEMRESKFLKSTRPLRSKTVIQYHEDYLIEKGLTLIGAPETYLKTLKQ